MKKSASEKTSLHSILYLTFIISFLHLIHALIFGQFSLGHANVKHKKQPDLPLRFRADGTFKILQVADMHYGCGAVTRCRDVLASESNHCSDLNSTRFLKRIIDAEKPDFIAFTGDNIFGTSTHDAAESMFEAFGPAMESRLPWAAVLGNHDHESTMTREELMSFISLMDYSVSQTNPLAEGTSGPNSRSLVEGIDGFGNYNLRIWGTPGSHLANHSVLNLYFLDSGDRAIVDGVRTYGWIKESQLRWLHDVSKVLQGQNQDKQESAGCSAPPALTFFHIPIPEIRHVKEIVGQYQEHVACSSVNSGVLRALVSMGDVKAVFTGHDHTNDFCGNLDGIWFCYGGGFGYHAYGRAGWPRRTRVILAELGKGENSWLGAKKIKTWKRLDDVKLSKIDEQVLWDWWSST